MTARALRHACLSALAAAGAACGGGGYEPGAGEGAPASQELEPRGVRLLDEPEYRATLAALLAGAVPSGAELPPAARQRGFSRNAHAVVDARSLGALYDLARSAASDVLRTGGIPELEACGANVDRGCAARVVAGFGQRAFRRPLTALEERRYLELYDAGAEGGTPRDGIELVVSTLLQSPWFLYATALGEDAVASPVVPLTSYELASELSYAIAGGPPDARLAALARGGALAVPNVREREARRLFGHSNTRFHYRRFVNEWLELDRLAETAKELGTYPDFPARRDDAAREVEEFVDRAMIERNGAFAALIAGEAGDRRGLLELPAFLAVHAHPSSSAPVLRGVAVLERVLCREFPTPEALGIEVTPPPPDAGTTTRERFEAHASDPACAGCHAEIDPLGGTFEGFGAVGEARSEDAGRPVVTAGQVTLDGFERPLANSRDLAVALAGSEEAQRCFARQVFRYLGARDDAAAEAAFEDAAFELPESRRASLVELAVAYVASERFAWRRSAP